MLNYIWLGLVLAAVIIGGCTGHLKDLTDGAFDATKTAVLETALPLVGFMALWLGIMRLAERSGLVQILARAIRPIMRRLFPDVPPEHPAMGSMLMNIAANMLGLGNAATPLGLRAMNDLEKLNPRPGIATNAMCTFLAINTASIQLIPATAVGILTAAGSSEPTAIIGTALIASACAALAGITSVKLLEKLPAFRLPLAAVNQPGVSEPAEVPPPAPPAAEIQVEPLRWWGAAILIVFAGLFAGWFVLDAFFPGALGRPVPIDPGTYAVTRLATASQSFAMLPFSPPLLAPTWRPAGPSPFAQAVGTISRMAIPFFLSFFPLYAALRRIKVYEEFVEGAKEGFNVAIRIIPFLVAILAAVGMFRAAGGIDMLSRALSPVLNMIGFPVDLLPMVLMRPLSGSGTTGLFRELVKRLGGDNLVTRMAGTIMGSTETTFYVLAVYFGSVSIRKTRHAVAAGLIADLTGVIASVTVCRLVFG
jgi:spore maturation protein SpmA